MVLCATKSRFSTNLTQGITLAEKKLITLQKHQSAPPNISVVRLSFKIWLLITPS